MSGRILWCEVMHQVFGRSVRAGHGTRQPLHSTRLQGLMRRASKAELTRAGPSLLRLCAPFRAPQDHSGWHRSSRCTMIILTAGLCWAYVLGEVCAIVSDMNSETQATRRDRASEKTHRSLTWEMMNSQWMPMGLGFGLGRMIGRWLLQIEEQ